MTSNGDRPPFAMRSVRRSNLVDEVIAQLRAQIERREARAGDRLPSEAEMARSLGVGRSTLREAMRVLAHLGLVESRSGTGTFLTGRHLRPVSGDRDVSIHELEQTLDFRYGVEVTACRLAALHRSEDQMQEMRTRWAACMALGASDAYAEFAERDFAFHRAVVAGAQNSLLLNAFDIGAEAIQRASRALLQLGPLEPMLHFHDALIESIARQDADAAESAVRENFDDVRRRIRMFEDSPRDGTR